MKKFHIQTSTGSCEIIVNESLRNLRSFLKSERTVIVTDRNVRCLYKDLFFDYDLIEIGQGERLKTLKTVEKIFERFLQLNLDRFSFILGVGGGIVCDITGFAASTFMRGLRFGFVPSSLLAQVDASVGGKNGVNFKGYKNIVGVFNQPQFVLLDFDLLKTLPKKEICCGLAEIIKHALIESSSLFHYLESEWPALLALETTSIEKTVVESIMIKSRIVRADAKESGERRKLNFGHTLGHALEKVHGLSHGQAISIGMSFASKISVAKGLLSAKEAGQIETLLHALKLPTQIPFNRESIFDAIRKDKKRHDGDIHFVLLEGIGKAEVTKMSLKELEGYLNDLREY